MHDRRLAENTKRLLNTSSSSLPSELCVSVRQRLFLFLEYDPQLDREGNWPGVCIRNQRILELAEVLGRFYCCAFVPLKVPLMRPLRPRVLNDRPGGSRSG